MEKKIKKNSNQKKLKKNLSPFCSSVDLSFQIAIIIETVFFRQRKNVEGSIH